MTSKLQAIDLLARWVEFDTTGLAGTTIEAPQQQGGVSLLRRESLLVETKPAATVNCCDCCEDHAKVRELLNPTTYRGFCDTCGSVDIPAAHVRRYLVNQPRVVSYIASGLDLKGRPEEIVAHHAWLLGRTSDKGKTHSWYFGRRLDQGDAADQFRLSIERTKATHAGTVLTTTPLQRLQRTPLRDLELVPLQAVALLGSMRFEMDREKLGPIAPQAIEDAQPETTLRYVPEGRVFIDGAAYDLEPRQQKILMALISHPDHEMSLTALRASVDSQSQTFSPRREFGRNVAVYERFIRYLPNDKVYQLLIPEGDLGWL